MDIMYMTHKKFCNEYTLMVRNIVQVPPLGLKRAVRVSDGVGEMFWNYPETVSRLFFNGREEADLYTA